MSAVKLNADCLPSEEGTPNTGLQSFVGPGGNQGDPIAKGLGGNPCIQGTEDTPPARVMVGVEPPACSGALNPAEDSGRASTPVDVRQGASINTLHAPNVAHCFLAANASTATRHITSATTAGSETGGRTSTPYMPQMKAQQHAILLHVPGVTSCGRETGG